MSTLLKSLKEAECVTPYVSPQVAKKDILDRSHFEKLIFDLIDEDHPYISKINISKQNGRINFTVNLDYDSNDMAIKDPIMTALHNFLLTTDGSPLPLQKSKEVCDKTELHFLESNIICGGDKNNWLPYKSAFVFNQIEYFIAICSYYYQDYSPSIFQNIFKIENLPAAQSIPIRLVEKDFGPYKKFLDIEMDVECNLKQEAELKKYLRWGVFTTYVDIKNLFNCLASLDKLPIVAVDTEHHSINSFYGLLALVQLAIRYKGNSYSFIIDPLAGNTVKILPELQRIFDRHDTIVLIHADSSDASWLYSYFRISLATFIIDTARIAQMLGETKCGLKNLCAKYLGLDIDKSEQKRNWMKRPLNKKQITYARDDVLLLFPLIRTLFEELDTKCNINPHNYLTTYAFNHMRTCLRPVKAPGFHALERYNNKLDNEIKLIIKNWILCIARYADKHPTALLSSHDLHLIIAEIKQIGPKPGCAEIFNTLNRTIKNVTCRTHIFSLTWPLLLHFQNRTTW